MIWDRLSNKVYSLTWDSPQSTGSDGKSCSQLDQNISAPLPISEVTTAKVDVEVLNIISYMLLDNL